MTRLINYGGVIIILLMTACAGLPADTLNKRIAIFEISYGQTLETIKLWIGEGRLNDADKQRMQSYVKDMHTARTTLRAAKAIDDLKTVDGQLRIANVSLQLLRDYIAEKEKIP